MSYIALGGYQMPSFSPDPMFSKFSQGDEGGNAPGCRPERERRCREAVLGGPGACPPPHPPQHSFAAHVQVIGPQTALANIGRHWQIFSKLICQLADFFLFLNATLDALLSSYSSV